MIYLSEILACIQEHISDRFGAGLPYRGAMHIVETSWRVHTYLGWLVCAHVERDVKKLLDDRILIVDPPDPDLPTLPIRETPAQFNERCHVLNHEWHREGTVVWAGDGHGTIRFDDGYVVVPGDSGSVVVDQDGEFLGMVVFEGEVDGTCGFCTREAIEGA